MEKAKRMRSSQSREWGQMDSNILICIFEKLLISDLLLGVSHVCKEWRMAASRTRFFIAGTQLNLLCLDSFSLKETAIYINLLKMALKTETNLDHVQFPEDVILPEDVTISIAQRSTSLKSLFLPQISVFRFPPSLLTKTLPYWNNLTSFEAITSRATAVSCIRLVGQYCKKLTHLGLYGIIEKPEAEAIVTCFPEIQSLDFRSCFFTESALDIILDGAKNLTRINLIHVIFADERDMKKLATKVLKERGAKNLKPEVRHKLAALETFLHCGGNICHHCSWFYPVEPLDL
ncbi:F-box/LRR-repeat protein At3g48880-like [Aristolochia californica]|uniref:F-box/LRR-repeat protein At3g48880-like n=1 Tax=Aristolochia californica TaxID=171875 RepID=UPI0035D9D4FD